MTQTHRTQPHSEALERAALSAALHFADQRHEVFAALSGEDFYTPRNGELFAVLRRLAQKSDAIDPLVVREACAGAQNAVAALDELEVHVSADIEPVLRTLRALTAARAVTRAAFEVAARGIECSGDPDGFLDESGRLLTRALAARTQTAVTVTAAAAVEAVLGDLASNGAEKAPVRLHTGSKSLDRALGGWEGGRLYVVAGRPGMGKTALAMQSAEHVANQGQRTLVFSAEMPPAELVARMLSGRARVSARAIQHRDVRDRDELARVIEAADELSRLPLVFVDAARMTIEEIARFARREKLQHGVSMVVLDYLQLVRSQRKFEREDIEIGEISRECKLTARELDVPFVLLSQLNRDVEKRQDKRPQMSDLKGSGSIEQDADTILFLYRGAYYGDKQCAQDDCEVIIGKQRGGDTGKVMLKFDARYTRFSG